MRIFSWSLLFIVALLLSACGQKGPLTLQRDTPAETQAEEQAPPEDQATEDDNSTTGDDDGDQ